MMNFLALGDLLGKNFDIQTSALGVLRTIVFAIDELVYKFIIILYNIFNALCNAQLMDTQLIKDFSSRIGLILGLVMFFYVAFDFIQMVLDPDKITDKEKGPINIIKKCVIVVLLLGLFPTIFNILNTVQSSVLNSDMIGKLILPYKVDIEHENFGYSLSANLMGNFYNITNDGHAKNAEKIDNMSYEQCEQMVTAFQNQIVTMGEFNIGYNCLNERYQYSGNDGDNITSFYINFNMISVIVGIFVAWMLIMYSISVGIRIIQLTVLQIISPMAAVSYLSPKKDTMLSKWWKIYFATYIDVFIRIAIIDIVVYLCGVILDNWMDGSNIFWNSVGNPGSGTGFWIGLFMILALLSFARKAPELIRELIPESASKLGFGIGLKGHEGLGFLLGGLTGGAVGLAGGIAGGKGVLGKISGAFSGLGGGIGRGLMSGAKAKDLRGSISGGVQAQAKANLARAQRIASGATFGERFGDSIRGTFGIQSGYAGYDTKLQAYDQLNNLMNSEDAVKYQEQALARANESLSEARLRFEEVRSRNLKPGDTEYDDVKKRLDAAERNVTNEDKRLSGIKNAIFEGIARGEKGAISDYKFDYIDENGVIHEGEDGKMATEFKVSGSELAAYEKVTNVSGVKYARRSEFKEARYALQAERTRKNKSG